MNLAVASATFPSFPQTKCMFLTTSPQWKNTVPLHEHPAFAVPPEKQGDEQQAAAKPWCQYPVKKGTFFPDEKIETDQTAAHADSQNHISAHEKLPRHTGHIEHQHHRKQREGPQ